jgi:undecaprenyl diphosphate synthase
VKPPELLKPASREEARLFEQLDPRRLPRHIAVIMDGNRRWVQRRHLPRVAGHRAGVESARTVIETCARLGIPALTQKGAAQTADTILANPSHYGY